MPNFFEAAAFSLHVYRDNHQPPIPEGWDFLMDCTEKYQIDGYFGAVYSQCIDPDNLFYDVVIAHRGTDNWPDIIQDIEMFFSQKIPAQFLTSAVPFVLEVIEFLDQKYGRNNYSITFTGHSLGASIAELCVAKWSNPDELSTLGITFESPGSKPLITQLTQDGSLPIGALEYAASVIVICNADVNAINSSLEHIVSPGEPHDVGYSYIRSDISEYPIPPDLWYFFFDFSKDDQHPMIKMYNYWKNSYSDTDLIDSEKIKKLKNNSEFRWPIGISNSFDYYMTYLPNRGGGYETTHQKYWDTYIQKCWDESELIHLEYKNDPKAFRANFIKTNLKQDPKLSIKKRLFNFNKKPLSPKKTKVWLYAIHIFFGLFILAELILALPLILIESSLLIGLDTGIHRFPEHLTYIISLLFTLGLFGCPLMYIFSLVRSIQTFKSNENKKAIRYALTPIFPFLFLMLMVLISSI